MSRQLSQKTIVDLIRTGSALEYDNRATKFSDEQLITMYQHFIGKGFQSSHAMEVSALALEAYSEHNPCDESVIYVLKVMKGYETEIEEALSPVA